MSEQIRFHQENFSFKDYLFKNKRNGISLMLAAIAIVIQFGIFKFFYPYASYIHGDSFSYLGAADKNLNISTYMIGYSKFLRIFNVFTTSDFALVGFQYLSLHISSLFLLFTVFFFYTPSKVVQIVLLGFMVFNPLFLHMGNLVSSDALFAALSITWFTLLIWIIHRPSARLVFWHTVVIFVCFTIRYNALIYIFIASLAFILSNLSALRKFIGITAAFISIGFFVLYTGNSYQKLTGYWQFSPFAGWQLANNAMYSYRYVDSSDRKPVPERFQRLDNMIRTYFDSTRDTARFPVEKIMASTFYMWSPNLPLFKYRDDVVYKRDSSSSELKKWASMGPFYKDYGLHIIRHYPGYFIRYFLWPNAQKYYAPPVEFLETYNSGRDSVADIAQIWFQYKSRGLKIRTKDKEITVLNFYPILSGVINVVMFFSLLSYVLLAGFRVDTPFRKGVLLGSVAWLLNAVFTIFASSAALRFQAFPMMLTVIFMSMLVDWLAKMASVKQDTKNPSNVELSVITSG